MARTISGLEFVSQATKPPLQLVQRYWCHARVVVSAAGAPSAWGGARFGACTSPPRLRTGSRSRSDSLLVTAASGASYTPYPWQPDDYYRVSLQSVQPAGVPDAIPTRGYFLLMRLSDDQTALEEPERALVMTVGGDTLSGVAQLVQGLPSGAAGGRPLSLDLLWQVLQRGQEISKRTWGVLRVAVVELRSSTYVGRVFFGDPATGVVAWDCDCRPSDACWLAIRSGAPIFVRKSVWESSAMGLADMQQATQKGQERAALERLSTAARDAVQTLTAVMTTPRDSDPEPLKLLKMEMRVALKDEDYAVAARIRDHPWMRMHLASVRALQAGDSVEAARRTVELNDVIRAHEAQERQDAGHRDADQQRRAQQQQQQQDSGGGGSGGAPGGGQFW